MGTNAIKPTNEKSDSCSTVGAMAVGNPLSNAVGALVVGASVGLTVGNFVGKADGNAVGAQVVGGVGDAVGAIVGRMGFEVGVGTTGKYNTSTNVKESL